MRVNSVKQNACAFKAVKIENIKEEIINKKIKDIAEFPSFPKDMQVYFIRYGDGASHGDLYLFGQTSREEKDAFRLIKESNLISNTIRPTKFFRIKQDLGFEQIAESNRDLRNLGIEPKKFDITLVKKLNIYS